jgi:hypothetical protein
MDRGWRAVDLGRHALEAKMRASFPSALSIALLSPILLFSSCSYLLGGPFPAYEQRIVAMTDFDAAVKAASGGSALQFINGLDYLESNGSSGVFVRLGTQDGKLRLLTFDGESLGAPVAYVFGAAAPFGSGFGLAASGDYVSGQLALKWDSRVPESTQPTPPVNTILLSEGGINYCFSTASSVSSLSALTYDASWAALSTITMPISATGSWSLISAGQGGGYYCFLFFRGDTNTYRAFRTTSVASMPWSSLFDDPTVSADYKTAEFSADRYSLWITADGPVTASNDNNGKSFSLLEFGAAASTSGYSLKIGGSASYSFESSGSYWFMYEAATGRLYKLRTWWK